MRENFKLPVSPERSSYLLEWYFIQEVCLRNTRYVAIFEQQEKIKSVSRWLVSSTKKFGLFLCGTPGNGKTTLVKALRDVFNYLKVPDPIGDLGSTPYAGIWVVSAKELFSIFETDRNRYLRCKDTYLLAIDDFGAEDVDFYLYGNHYTPIKELLSYRYDRMLPTILTTNLSLPIVRQKYGDRLADRFNEMMEIVHLPDINFRNREE